MMNSDGSDVKNISAGYDKSISSILWSKNSKLVYALVNVEGNTHIISINQSGAVKTLVTDVGGTSVGRPYASGNYSIANGVLAYTQADSSKLADLAVMKSGSVKTWTDLNADLANQVDFAPIEEFTVKSRHDGLEIEAWVALPKGFKADGSFPMILEIHGGPFAMYGAYFAAEIQRYAAEGYVTVYVNPRGSTGYGEEFAQSIDKAYPGFDHDDLMSVVDDLVARKYVDDKRLFITGGSGGGGGYLALCCALLDGHATMGKPRVLLETVATFFSRKCHNANHGNGRRRRLAHTRMGSRTVLHRT